MLQWVVSFWHSLYIHISINIYVRAIWKENIISKVHCDNRFRVIHDNYSTNIFHKLNGNEFTVSLVKSFKKSQYKHSCFTFPQCLHT